MTSAVNLMQPIRSWHRLAIGCSTRPTWGYCCAVQLISLVV